MKRRVIALGVGVVLALGVAPAAWAEDGPCGQAPGPHCRPMDCEIVWTDSGIEGDVIDVPPIPQYKCYN
jgi:hypothetical protein